MPLSDRLIRVRVLDRNGRSIPNATVHVFVNEKLATTATAGSGENGTVYTAQVSDLGAQIGLDAEYQDGSVLKKLPAQKLAPEVNDWTFVFSDVELPPPKSPRPLLWAGFICGAVALLFFMALALLPSFGNELKCSQHFPAIIVLALAAGLSGGFLGGSAKASGKIPLGQNLSPVEFAAAGGVATIIIILVLGWLLYVKDCRDTNANSPARTMTTATTST